jgi:bifunctional DNA-binding transcriptional regulator/antitoxin component of YhaV-PrlF toxin-antitoxin module
MQKVEVLLGKKSAVSSANSVSKSLRTTIPNEIAENLSLEAGDIVDWEIVSHNGKKYARVRKLE